MQPLTVSIPPMPKPIVFLSVLVLRDLDLPLFDQLVRPKRDRCGLMDIKQRIIALAPFNHLRPN